MRRMNGYSGDTGQPYLVGSSRSGGVLGLSIVHISPRAAAEKGIGRPAPRVMRRYVGGSLVQLGGQPASSVPRGGRRGRIVGYSARSRRELMKALDAIDQDQAGLPQFVTLTYPADWPGDWRVWKKHLDRWVKRLRREHPEAWGVWRLEPQRRGAPHFHLLIWGARIDKQWCSRSWFEVVGSGDERHLRAGTQVARVRSWGGVKHYTAKYLSKVADEMPEGWDRGVGRWWGWIQKQAMPCEPVDAQLDAPAWFAARRVLWQLQRKAGLNPYRWGRCGTTWRLRPETATALQQWAMALSTRPPSSAWVSLGHRRLS